MLQNQYTEALARISSAQQSSDRFDLLRQYHPYTLEVATKERVLLRHGRRTLCEITVKRGRVCVDLDDYGVFRFAYRGKDAIHAVCWLAEGNEDYLVEKWELGGNSVPPVEWKAGAAAHDLLEHLEEYQDESTRWEPALMCLLAEQVELSLGASLICRLEASDLNAQACQSFFNAVLGEIDWELPSLGMGLRPSDAFLHCLHAAREAKRQLAKLI